MNDANALCNLSNSFYPIQVNMARTDSCHASDIELTLGGVDFTFPSQVEVEVVYMSNHLLLLSIIHHVVV